MRKWQMASIGVMLLSLCLVAGCGQSALPDGETMIATRQEGIWVAGRGEAVVTPDVANLRIGVEAQEATVTEAQAKAAGAMDSIMDALSAAGVADEDIQTQRFSIRQVTRYDRTEEEEVVVGYEVVNTVSARIRQIDRVGEIIDAAVEAGGGLTRIDSISFSVDDPSVYYDQARTEAVADARDKAEQLANLAGVDLGRPVFISEGSESPPIRPLEAVAESPAEAAPVTTPISPGQTRVTLTVQVAYAILD